MRTSQANSNRSWPFPGALTRLQGCCWVVDQGGGSLVEFALSATLLVGMFFGVFSLCEASYTYHYVSEAAREGARFAMVRGSTSCTNTPSLSNCNATNAQIGAFVKNLGYPGINSTAYMTVTASWLKATTTINASNDTVTTWAACTTGTCNLPGSMVKVVVTYAFHVNTPFVSPTVFNLGSTAQMVVAQ